MPQAAIVRSPQGEVVIEHVAVSDPRDGEVLVEVAMAGVCAHDIAAVRGGSTVSPFVPGHGGAGVVVGLGCGVTSVGKDDHVVLCGPVHCGRCYWCLRGEGALCPIGEAAAHAGTMLDGGLRLRSADAALRQFRSVGSWSAIVAVPEWAVVPIHSSVDLATAALIDCSVLEGLAAATRAAHVSRGDTVVVLGTGSVGLHAIQGARFGGAGAIVAMGEGAGLLEEDMGATHPVETGQEGDLVELVVRLTNGRGADVVIDTRPAASPLDLALQCTRRGGQLVITEAGTRGPARTLTREFPLDGHCTVRSGAASMVRPREDVPILFELHESGLLRLDRPASEMVPLADVTQAVDRLVSGIVQQVRVTHN